METVCLQIRGGGSRGAAGARATPTVIRGGQCAPTLIRCFKVLLIVPQFGVGAVKCYRYVTCLALPSRLLASRVQRLV